MFSLKGDRAGICVTQFDPKLLERGLICTPGTLPTIDAAIISVRRIPYFKGDILTKAKFHISMLHDTVMAKVSFFGLYDAELPYTDAFDFEQDYRYQYELLADGKRPRNIDGEEEEGISVPKAQFALLEFEHPITCTKNCLVIGSRLDTDIHSNTCRLAFHGELLSCVSNPKYAKVFLPRIKVFKNKSKEGTVERKVDDYAVICKGLFKKETNLDLFVNLRVQLSTGEKGIIESSFGQSGKFKVRIPGKSIRLSDVNFFVISGLRIRTCLMFCVMIVTDMPSLTL